MVRTDGRAYGHVITKLSQIGRLPHFLRYGALSTRALRAWSSGFPKTSDPSPPTPNKVEFGAKWVKLSAFFGHNIARGSGGDDGMNPKPNKKLSLGAESYGTIAWRGFFTQSQVLLSSIVGYWGSLSRKFCPFLGLCQEIYRVYSWQKLSEQYIFPRQLCSCLCWKCTLEHAVSDTGELP